MDDVEEIKKLKARYFRFLDSKDWDGYANVFADDCIVDLVRVGSGIHYGRTAFAAFASALPLVQSVHQGHMPEIDLTGPETASGVWALEDYNVWEDGTQHHGWGHYLETYVKRDGRWYIKTMALSYLRIDHTCPEPTMIAGSENTAHLRGMQPGAVG